MMGFTEWTYMAMKAMLNLLIAAAAGLFGIGILLLVVIVVACTVQELKKRGKKDE